MDFVSLARSVEYAQRSAVILGRYKAESLEYRWLWEVSRICAWDLVFLGKKICKNDLRNVIEADDQNNFVYQGIFRDYEIN